MLLTQIIYVDDNNKLSRWKKSFLSIKQLENIDVFVSGYVSGNYLKIVNEILKDTKSKIYMDNMGKSYVINDVVDNIEHSVYIFMDSDIVLENNTIIDLINVYEKSNFNVLVPFQKEDSRHHINDMEEKMVVDRNVIKWTKKCSLCFSGGIFITSKDVLKENRFILFGSYGPDDTYFFKNVFKKNKSIGMVEDVCVIHPFDLDIEYENHKKLILKNWHMLG
jgi:glycosyltransferase involved in cell wall biosynthesis